MTFPTHARHVSALCVEAALNAMCDQGMDRHSAIKALAMAHGIFWDPNQPDAFHHPDLNRLEDALGLPRHHFLYGPM